VQFLKLIFFKNGKQRLAAFFNVHAAFGWRHLKIAALKRSRELTPDKI